MALNTVIESLGVYIPEGRLTTKKIIDGCRVRPVLDLEDLTGIKTRPVVGENEYALDLSRKAASKCFEISRHSPEDMDLVICTNISRHNGPNFKANFEPSTAALLAKYFDFGRAIIFDEPNACAGMFTALHVVDAYIKAGLIKRGLVISGEYLTCLTQNAQKEMKDPIDPQFACLTVGDSGAAFILEGTDNPDIGFHDMDVFTIAKHWDLCIGTASEEEHGGFVMYTDSVAIHSIAIGLTAEHVGRTVKGTAWENSANHHYIMHQTAVRAIATTRKSINNWVGGEVCSKNNTIVNVQNRGNNASTAHFVALWDHINNGAIKSGENILFAVQSSGINLGVSMYTLDDLPERIMAVEQANIDHAHAINA
ncbi:MAG: 3-oxoacyl-[acyl-carrier-protein] synthase III C-terminal domain-containing protein [Thermodesulfobacteriota bacterium]|nr:3-oxoacyl-[acyl-carrier-protein] synthase III C-terminal domain-containing protein [Thermodesulfobacteriota bacterium]